MMSLKTREAIARRCSCKRYKADQISEKELNIVLQGANAAPIGMGNYQSVRLTVVQDQTLLAEIDREGAKFFGDLNLHPLYGAPTLIVVSGDMEDIELAMCNVSCMIENMLIAATDIGLGSCYIRGNIKAIRNNRDICKQLKVPEGFLPCGAVILGYPAEMASERELVTDKFAVDYIR
ncbi:MAG: nitroreductase family protein [Emergencia sp.]|nr:nitroreductase family protein [Emergencia sp.]